MTTMTTQRPTGSLSERAILAEVHIHMWTARRHDKRVSEDVRQQNNATVDPGRYMKKLMPHRPESYKRVEAAAREIRAWHYGNTLPWCSAGPRILSAERLLDYGTRLDELVRDFDNAASVFCLEYEKHRQEAERALGDMFNADDYPKNIASRFGITRNYLPLPDSDDFRCSLDANTMKALAESTKRATERALRAANRDLWERLHKVVDKMAVQLGKAKNSVHSSLVDNVTAVVELLPQITVLDDPDLEHLRQRTLETLCAHTTDDLSNDKQLRERVRAEAAAVANKMAGFMGAAR